MTEFERLQAITESMQNLGLIDVEITVGTDRVRVRRHDWESPGSVGGLPTPIVDISVPLPATLSPNEHAIRAALAGTFYASPRSGAAPFVKPGDPVQSGSVVGLIEAMKVFNEINSDREGVVQSVLVRSGESVVANQPIVLLDTGASPRSDQRLEGAP